MTKNSIEYWYDYLDVNILLRSKSNNDCDYKIIEAASQDNLNIVQKVNEAVSKLQTHERSVVIPINLGNSDTTGNYQGSHWVALVIKKNKDGNINAFYNDSFGISMDDSLTDLRNILINHSIDSITDFKIKQQYNNFDCGPWTVFNLDYIARNGVCAEKQVGAIGYQMIEGQRVLLKNLKNKLDTETLSISNMLYEQFDNHLEQGDRLASTEIEPKSVKAEEKKVNKFEIKAQQQEYKEFSKLLAPVKFIINVPMYVSATDTEEYSSSEEEDEKFIEQMKNFKIDEVDSFPYRTFDIKTRVSKKNKEKKIIKKKIGSLSLKNQDEMFKSDKFIIESSKTDELLKLLSLEGFDKSQKDHLQNIAVSIGLNRPLSISTRKNNCLNKELYSTENSTIEHEKFAFFWNMPWTDSNGKCDAKTYEEARHFYKKLKKRDKEAAKKFLDINEISEGPSPPYQYIREYVKDHPKTVELTQKLNTENSIEYFSFIDSDTKSFNKIYSTYLKMIETYKTNNRNVPTVMSTGYEFGKEDGFPLYVGSKLEHIVRSITAETLPGAVYYPEPNFCILIPKNHNTLPYTFIDKKNLLANLESPTLLRQVLLRSDHIFIFSKENSLITSGNRAKKSELKFSEEFNNGCSPNESDLSELSNIIQSTAAPRAWAQALYYNRCFKVRGKQGASGSFNKYITDLFNDKDISNALIELKKMVDPSSTVDHIYRAIINVRSVLNKFYHPFKENEINDDSLYDELREEFYHLNSSNMIKIIRLHDSTDESLLYRALNDGYSLYEILKMIKSNDEEKFKAIFSNKSACIYNSEDVSYRGLEELYDDIIKAGGDAEDFKELINDKDGLFNDEYGELDFEEVIGFFLSTFDSYEEDCEVYEEPNGEEIQSAYNVTVDHFYQIYNEDNEVSSNGESDGSSDSAGDYNSNNNSESEENLYFNTNYYELNETDLNSNSSSEVDTLGDHNI